MDLAAAPRSQRLHGLSRSVRRADAVDLPAVTRLINRAYGCQRADEAEVRGMAEHGHFLVLDTDGVVAAAVYVRVDDAAGRVTMLAVAPELQGLGLGSRLLAVAEALCTALGRGVIELALAGAGEASGAWCRRRGYRDVAARPAGEAAWLQKPLPRC